MSAFTPCPSCQRHVRLSDEACPFCGSDLAGASAPLPPARVAGLGRAAIFALGATLGAVGCSSTEVGGFDAANGGSPIDAGPDVGGFDAAYGGPPIDAGPDAGPDAGGFDAAGPAPAYGAPPDDEG